MSNKRRQPRHQSDAKTCDRPRGNSKTTKPTACGVCQGARCSCLKISSAALASAFSASLSKEEGGETGKACVNSGGGTATNNIFCHFNSNKFWLFICSLSSCHPRAKQNLILAQIGNGKADKIFYAERKKWWERPNSTLLLVAGWEKAKTCIST